MRAKAYSTLYLCYICTDYKLTIQYTYDICYVLRFTMMMRSDRTRGVSVDMWYRVLVQTSFCVFSFFLRYFLLRPKLIELLSRKPRPFRPAALRSLATLRPDVRVGRAGRVSCCGSECDPALPRHHLRRHSRCRAEHARREPLGEMASESRRRSEWCVDLLPRWRGLRDRESLPHPLPLARHGGPLPSRRLHAPVREFHVSRARRR